MSSSQQCWYCLLEDQDARQFVEAVRTRYTTNPGRVFVRRLQEVLKEEFDMHVTEMPLVRFLKNEHTCH